MLAPRHEPDAVRDGRLLRAAEPVLKAYCDQLCGTGTGMILCDQRGLVLHMWSGDDRLARLLDDAHSNAAYIPLTDDAAQRVLGIA